MPPDHQTVQAVAQNRAAHERDEHVRRATRERDVDRTPDVDTLERLRWQPVGVRGHLSGAAVDAQHRTGRAVCDIERPAGTDRAPGDEVVAAELGQMRHHRISPVVGADRRRGHRGRQSNCGDQQTDPTHDSHYVTLRRGSQGPVATGAVPNPTAPLQLLRRHLEPPPPSGQASRTHRRGSDPWSRASRALS